MQPLISPIDHESRHNSYRAEEEPRARASEATPLLHRVPPGGPAPPPPPLHARLAAAVVSLLVLILIGGIVIGIYLLVVQSNSENVLPPVESAALQLVSAAQWAGAAAPTLPTPAPPEEAGAPYPARHVIVVDTGTPPCHSTAACAHLLRGLQVNASESLPFNFLVSSDGQTYEALGWRRPSTLFPQDGSSLVLAFIGNFTDTPPTRAQLDGARNFIAESVSLRRLSPAYSVVGKTLHHTPTRLFQALSSLPRWSTSLSDSY